VQIRSPGRRVGWGFILLLALLLALAPLPATAAGGSNGTLVGYYFTGEGCPHCAKVNPVLFGEWPGKYPGLVVVEYEVWQHQENAGVMAGMTREFGLGLGIPVITFGRNATFSGDKTILSGVPGFLNASFGGAFPGTAITLDSLDIAGLMGYPRLWEGDRVLVREGEGGDADTLRALLAGGDPAAVLAGTGFQDLGPLEIDHGDLKARFEHSLRVDGWLVGWNGEAGTGVTPETTATTVPATAAPTVTVTTGATTVPATGTVTPAPTEACPSEPELTAGQIMALAAVNAINPCALAVLVVILLAIITNNPGKREQVLLAGLAFCLSVFIFYLLYGLVLVSLLAGARGLPALQGFLTRALGLVSIIIGILHIREYNSPGKDSLGTAIPRGWRRRLGELLTGITTPVGAFITGGLVTLFLLPCNIAPYIIGCGILSVYGPLVALPYLLLYNLVFILPMLGITAIVYLGVARIHDVKGWREKNIGRFHLVSGAILVAFGILLLTGLI
jgi:threonine/homoserine/homoserine lactone efflux protein